MKIVDAKTGKENKTLTAIYAELLKQRDKLDSIKLGPQWKIIEEDE